MPPKVEHAPEDFQKAFRAHNNFVEQLAIFLPIFVVFSLSVHVQYGFYLGLAWWVARVFYWVGYTSPNVENRVVPFLSSIAISVIMGLGTLAKAIWWLYNNNIELLTIFGIIVGSTVLLATILKQNENTLLKNRSSQAEPKTHEK